MIRDILNHLGEKIGELELPDETSEEVWEKKLAFYAIPPVEVSEIQEVEETTWSKADLGFEMYLKLVAMLDVGGGPGSVDQSLQIYPLISQLRCLLKDGFFGMAYRYYVTQIQPMGVLQQEINDAFKSLCTDLILKFGGTMEEIKSYEEI